MTAGNRLYRLSLVLLPQPLTVAVAYSLSTYKAVCKLLFIATIKL